MTTNYAPTEPQVIDTLVSARWVIPVEPANTLLQDHAVAIDQGKIIAILPQQAAKQRYDAKHGIDLPGHALMPGLINAHGHAAMSLFRGMADDTPLHTWLQQHIWPAEQRWVSEEFVRDGTRLAMAEMIRSGTTTFSDMYFFPNIVAREAAQAGMRCQLSFPIFDFPTIWGKDADDYISKGLQLRDDFKHSELVAIVFGPHAPYTVSDAPLQRIATLAAELDVGIQIHAHETQQEVLDDTARLGRRPLDRLNSLNLLGPKTQLVHMTALTDEDIQQVADSGAHVIHCPHSNMKLASGICPVTTLLNKGINVALGTDGAASNNGLSLFAEMRTASLLAKLTSSDAAALNDWQSLQLATNNGARALALEERIGSLTVGKQADMIAVDLSQLEQQPLYHPLAQLTYTDCSHRVSHSWINGQLVMADRELYTLNEQDILETTRRWRQQIQP